MERYYILDTNVSLFDPQAIFKFSDHNVVIPMSVIEEVDRFKRDLNENGRNARQFSRIIDDMRSKGSLAKGAPMEKGGRLLVDFEADGLALLPPELNPEKADNRILAVVMKYKREYGRKNVLFITKDTNLRVKADILGIWTEDYHPREVVLDEMYSGIARYEVASDAIETFFAEKQMPIDDPELCPNEYIILVNKEDPSHTALGRYDADGKSCIPLKKTNPEGVQGILPKNVEQQFAMDLLLDDDIPLVTLVGKAGTGKTLVALAAGLQKTLDEEMYHRMLVSRPIFPLGKDIGYLPGDIEEKLNPWMGPIFDNLEFILSGAGAMGNNTERRRRGSSRRYQELINQGMVNIEPLTYIRGRSIPQQYMIVDEAQNLTPHEIKTIITRAGHNTKIVLTGDPYQIDNPYIDSMSNGLVYVVERFKGEGLHGHVTLQKGERSALSELATNVM
jgi:PhoH-like ATPase